MGPTHTWFQFQLIELVTISVTISGTSFLCSGMHGGGSLGVYDVCPSRIPDVGAQWRGFKGHLGA